MIVDDLNAVAPHIEKSIAIGVELRLDLHRIVLAAHNWVRIDIKVVRIAGPDIDRHMVAVHQLNSKRGRVRNIVFMHLTEDGPLPRTI